jgi:hypothetical protein
VDPYQSSKKTNGFQSYNDENHNIEEESNNSDELRSRGTLKGLFQGVISKQSLANRIIVPEEDQQKSCKLNSMCVIG